MPATFHQAPVPRPILYGTVTLLGFGAGGGLGHTRVVRVLAIRGVHVVGKTLGTRIRELRGIARSRFVNRCGRTLRRRVEGFAGCLTVPSSCLEGLAIILRTCANGVISLACFLGTPANCILGLARFLR